MKVFIHIGKTGGTTINTLLKKKLKNYKEYHLVRNYKENEKYIIWIRNPICRFVSAFNHSYYGVHTNIESIKSFDLDHCLIPGRMKNSIGNAWVFSEEYDELIKIFTSANHLAESLTSSDIDIQQKAIKLMQMNIQHIHTGIHWYLNDYKYLKNKIIFVGRTEFMKKDICRLSKRLKIDLDENLKLRENVYIDKSMKYLSPLAIENLINWYKPTDYKILKLLLDDGWINENTFHMYHTYNNL